MHLPDVLAAFKLVARDKRVFKQRELTRLVRGQLDNPNLLDQTEILSTLLENKAVQKITFKSEHDYQPITRFATDAASPFELAVALRANSYLCHSTAVFIHGLTDNIPQTIYLNAEQSSKPRPSGRLTQGSIDRAFRAHQRTSRYVFIHGRHRFVILSGKNTGRYGVVLMPSPTGETVPVTDLERTLVDIAVRPVYGGGVHAVLQAFRSALDRVAVVKLLDTLQSLDYVYPYHQVLGFYLERAGLASAKLESLRAKGLRFDFYLAHGLKSPEYSSSWRIYYPKGL